MRSSPFVFPGRVLPLLLLLLFAPVAGAGAQEGGRPDADCSVLAVMGTRLPPYEAALDGFRAVSPCAVRTLVLAETDRFFSLPREVSATRPTAVLAVGPAALRASAGIRSEPVVYTMVLEPERFLGKARGNIRGVRMVVDPEEQLQIFARSLPGIRHIGLVYDPEHSESLVRRALAAAPKVGLLVTARGVPDRREVIKAVHRLMDEPVDALWLLPDRTVVSDETIEYIFLLSVEHGVPVLSFSKKHVAMGALLSMSVAVDAARMGRQAAVVLGEAIGGASRDRGPLYARRGEILINFHVARALSVRVRPD